MNSRRILSILFFIVVFAFLFRISPIIYLEINDRGYHDKNINEIEYYYDDVARSLIAGKGFVHSVNPRSETSPYNFKPGTPFGFVPPLYSWWLAIIYKIFGPSVLIGKIFQSLLDSLTCLMIFLIGRRIFKDNRMSIVASVLYAVYPLAIVMCSTLYYQIPMNVTLCWLTLCFMGPVSFLNGIWTGVAVATSSLAKPVTLPLIAIMPMIRLVESYVKKANLRIAMIWMITFLIASIAILTPWTIRNYNVFNKFVPIQQGGPEAFYQGSEEKYIDLDVITLRKTYGNYGMKRDQLAKAAVSNHIEHFKRDPADYIRFLGKKFLLSWFNTEGKSKNIFVLIVQIPFILFAVFGLLYHFRFWVSSKNWYVPATILYICAIQVATFPLVRYTLVVMPFVMLLAASGIDIFISKWLGKKLKNPMATE